MFTGLVREIGTLGGITSRGGVLRLVIKAPHIVGGLAAGDSVAVNGICLTVVAVGGRSFTVEAAAETKRLTTLPGWSPGRRVHLEPALRMGDALDGHLVQGHIDGVGSVKSLQPTAGGHLLKVGYPADLGRFLTAKGSVAIDGVSLTVDDDPWGGSFAVNLIPHTMQRTAFGGLRPGQKVNLEMDVLVKAALQGGRHPLAAARGATTNSGLENPPNLTLARILAAGFTRKTSRGPTS